MTLLEFLTDPTFIGVKLAYHFIIVIIVLPISMRIVWDSLTDFEKTFPLSELDETDSHPWRSLFVSDEKWKEATDSTSMPFLSKAGQIGMIVLVTLVFFILTRYVLPSPGYIFADTTLFSSIWVLTLLYVGVFSVTFLQRGKRLFENAEDLGLVYTIREMEADNAMPSQAKEGHTLGDLRMCIDTVSPKLQKISLSLALFVTATLATNLPWIMGEAFFENIILFTWVLIIVLFGSFLVLFVQLEMKIHAVLIEHKNMIHRVYLRMWERNAHQLATILRKSVTPSKEQIDAMETVRSLVSDVESLPVWTIQRESIVFLIGSIIMPIALTIFALF